MEAVKWENGILSIPIKSEMIPVLDQAGNDGWEPWAVIGVDDKEQTVRIAVKRPKRMISLATEMPSN